MTSQKCRAIVLFMAPQIHSTRPSPNCSVALSWRMARRDDVMDKVKARSIDLPASVFKGRDPKSIWVLRFVCSNHPRLSVGVALHSEDGSGACSYLLDRTSPPPQ